MPYYYDWIDRKYIETKRSPQIEQPLTPRGAERAETLLPELIKEIETGDSEIKLYAGMLARRLVSTEYYLMRNFGEKVAKLTDPPKTQKTVKRAA
jgi:hypothetical protein